MNIAISADAVAWYAALVGTGGLCLGALNAWRDRARILVKATHDWRVQGGGYDPEKVYVSITVSNRGRRPVTLAKVWLEPKDPTQKRMFLHDSFLRGPRELTEGKATDYMIDQSGLDLASVKRVVVADVTGREWQTRFEIK